MWTTSAQFVGEAWAELKKVTWPGRKETLGTTLVVIFLVVVVAIYLGLVDYALSRIVRGVIR
ncbi:MAG: preprotein translocase subunit SecE [Deltaproteobacteria bacterium]|nr:preprotein translocase subunit SecE [Deltaproteobacteria bacterium]